MILFLYVVMCVIFGTTFLFIKLGLSLGWSPILFASLRFSIAGVLLLGVMTTFKHRIPTSLIFHKEVMIVSFLMTTIPFAALYHSEQYITSSMAAIIVATAPVFILLLNHLLGNNKLLIFQAVGIGLGMAGIILIFLSNLGLMGDSFEFRAQVLLLLAEVAFAYGSIRAKKFLNTDINLFVFTGIQMLYGGLFLLIWGIISREEFSIPGDIKGWLLMVYFVFIASILANGIYYWLMKKTNALFPSTWTYVSPVIAMFSGWVILKEELSWANIGGAFLIIIGIVFTNVEVVKFVKKKKRNIYLPIKAKL